MKEERDMRTSIVFGSVLLAASVAGGSIYNESVDGDLSDDRFAPTFINFETGLNTVINQSVDADIGGDIDYFTVTIGAGQWIDSIVVIDATNPFGGLDTVAFIGLAFDNFFDFNIDDFSGDGVEGFVLTDPSVIGAESIGELSGGLSTLGAGDYTFWVQQGNVEITEVTLGINVAPAPGAMGLLGIAGFMAVARRR